MISVQVVDYYLSYLLPLLLCVCIVLYWCMFMFCVCYCNNLSRCVLCQKLYMTVKNDAAYSELDRYQVGLA